MARHEIDRDLRIQQEGPNVRATAGALDILFPKSEREAVMAAYNEWRGRVLSHFEPRWRDHKGANFDEADFLAIIREITLHWIGFCVMHRMPVQMGAAEWDQPQTRRIIRLAVERRFARGSDEAAALCAQLMGISREAYLKWVETEDTFLGMI
jgi:hypothetical protein